MYTSPTATEFTEWKRVDNILDPVISQDSLIYFVSEVEDENYEVVFGDGVLGKALDNGNVIQMSYVVTHGKDVNGAKTFTFGGVLEDASDTLTVPFSVSNITTVEKAYGGEDIESIAKIKYLAPKFFSSQNRAVTSSDYEVIARNVYPAISDIIVFGGEEQVPPDYGKVFIAIKPSTASFLSAYTKNQIVKDLKKYSVGSIRPVLVDPSILYVELTSNIFFDGTKTELLPQQVAGNAAKFNAKICSIVGLPCGEDILCTVPNKIKKGSKEFIKEMDLERSKMNIQRFKGLGEMNPEELWSTTLDPETRNLLQVQYSKDLKKDQSLIHTLMGNDVALRKDFIVSNAINVRNLDI